MVRVRAVKAPWLDPWDAYDSEIATGVTGIALCVHEPTCPECFYVAGCFLERGLRPYHLRCRCMPPQAARMGGWPQVPDWQDVRVRSGPQCGISDSSSVQSCQWEVVAVRKVKVIRNDSNGKGWTEGETTDGNACMSKCCASTNHISKSVKQTVFQTR